MTDKPTDASVDEFLLQAIRARLAALPQAGLCPLPDERRLGPNTGAKPISLVYVSCGQQPAYDADDRKRLWSQTVHIADFVRAAPDDMRALLEMIERLRADLALATSRHGGQASQQVPEAGDIVAFKLNNGGMLYKNRERQAAIRFAGGGPTEVRLYDLIDDSGAVRAKMVREGVCNQWERAQDIAYSWCLIGEGGWGWYQLYKPADRRNAGLE